MSQQTSEKIPSGITMPEPSKELAEHLTRELEWAERIEGSIFDAGPGTVTQRIYRLEHLSSMLEALPNFSVDFHRLRSWAEDGLGDPVLAEALDAALREAAAEDADGERRDVRSRVVEIVRTRVEQCAEALREDEAGEDGAADGEG